MKLFTRLTLVGIVLAVPTIASAAARAELRPGNDLTVDTPAQLIITVDGDHVTAPRFDLDDARVRYNGQADRTTVINGKMSRQTVFMYTVTPQRAGALDIPAIRVGRDQTSAIHADVGAEPRAARTTAAATAEHEPTRAFVRIDAPKRAVYVGEAVPVRIRAYFRGGVAATLQGNPHLTSSAFTLDHLSDKPEQKQIEIDGVPYLQATWTATLSAAKPTTDKVTVELPVEIAYRERRAAAPQQRPQQRRSIRDIFGSDPFAGDPFADAFGGDPFADDSMFGGSFFDQDPFAGFDSMFEAGEVRQQQLTLRHTAAATRVAELPEKGQPQPFSGAVGSFKLAMELPKEALRVGEPATLTFRVQGSGNFDHVAVEGIPASADWKVYPGKTELAPDGETKTITQTIVPTRAGSLEIPAVSFNYFDPKKGDYRTAQTSAAHVDVAPNGAADPDLASSSTRDSGMTPNRVAASRPHSTLTPLLMQPSFWMYPGALALLLAIQFGVALGQERWRSRGMNRRVASEQRKARAAARVGDAAGFFGAARTALQVALAEQWDVRPESITAADVDRRLGENGAEIRDLFDRADHIKYAHHDVAESPASLEQWRSVVDAQLAKLEVVQ
jgi:hypothetical protein